MSPGSSTAPAGTPSAVTPRFAFHTLVIFLNSVGGQVLGWVATKELFLHVAPSPGENAGLAFLGLATLYTLIASMISTIGDLRIGSAYVFFVARGGRAGNLTAAYLLFRIAALALLAGGFALLAPVIAPWLGLSLPKDLLPLDLFLFLPLLETPSFVYAYLTSAQARAADGIWPFVVENVLRTAGLVYVAFIWTFDPTVAGHSVDLLGFRTTIQLVGPGLVQDIAEVYVVAAAVACISIIVHSRVSARGLFRGLSFDGMRGELRTMSIFAAPLVGAMFLTYAVSSLPPFVVAAAFTGPNATKYVQGFASANAFLLLLMFLPNAITVPLFPDMASLFVRGENRELRRRTRKSMRWTVLILAPAVLASIVFRKVLLNDLYTGAITSGPWDAELALAILAASSIPQALFRITGSVLDGVGQQKRELYLSATQLVVLVAASLVVLWPTSPLRFLGITGAALAVLFSMSAGSLANFWFLHRYVKANPSPWPYLKIIGAAAVTFLLFSTTFSKALGSLLGDPDLAIPVQISWVLAITILAGVVLYTLILAGIGELTKEDVRELGGSLGLPRRLIEFVARFCWRVSWPDPPGDDEPFPRLPTRWRSAGR
ncbi:MAG: polysaccharide biosynthesis C-terminal domain-containing protein [Euryarchaeota archaeon]|nr:polysaccharide biosynthesis C-terminal domain-containing protein [Euryarchaeota archaeon]MDE2044906.1 polysaccharide biosynthesis C-terminal domain-containing protein [Thermoplasmata archaeon]